LTAVRDALGVGEVLKDLPDDVALQAPLDLSGALAFGGATSRVFLRAPEWAKIRVGRPKLL